MDDAIYYRDAGSIATARSVSARARINIYRTFVNKLRPGPGSKILDLGVSAEEGPEANMLEKQYPWQQNITCAGLGDGKVLREAYPSISYVKITPGAKLPFAANEFDIVHSNAVLEHVGGRDERAEFLREASRVGKSMFIAIPNKWFPMEHHTAIPFLHWSPPLFRALIKRTRLHWWADPHNLDFLGASNLLYEWHSLASAVGDVEYVGLRLGPLSSNLALIVQKGAAG